MADTAQTTKDYIQMAHIHPPDPEVTSRAGEIVAYVVAGVFAAVAAIVQYMSGKKKPEADLPDERIHHGSRSERRTECAVEFAALRSNIMRLEERDTEIATTLLRMDEGRQQNCNTMVELKTMQTVTLNVVQEMKNERIADMREIKDLISELRMR